MLAVAVAELVPDVLVLGILSAGFPTLPHLLLKQPPLQHYALILQGRPPFTQANFFLKKTSSVLRA